mmetsp:Transcript_3531/g.4441  ORF Transcript_3531/g.4441 Transcript_3531/m.4441 type:complete len:122 (-) Transcript_3531:46-411(-)
MREPVLALAGLLDGLAAKLTRHVPKLIQAREAVENPTHQVVDWIEAGYSSSTTAVVAELPIVILRGRGSLGEVYKSVRSVGDGYAASMGRALRRRGDEEVAKRLESLPPEERYSPYVLAYA